MNKAYVAIQNSCGDIRAAFISARHDRGASMVEYGLLLALILLVCMVSYVHVADSVNTMFVEVNEKVSSINN